MLTRLEGYLLIPHELLHVAGYRLVGKQCAYRWGDHQVRPVGPLTRRERLVGLLFPFTICMLAWLLLLPWPIVALIYGSMLWFVIFFGLSGLVFLYAFASVGDLRQAYLLLYKKDASHKTPFDFLFWPVLKERVAGVRHASLVILICLVLLYVSYLWLQP